MRINVYNTLLDDDRKPMLVKESSSNFPAVSQIKAPQDLVKILNGVFNANNQTEEHVWLIALNSANAIIGIFELSHGSINSSIMSTREIFMKLCLCGAANFMLAHNHPSGETAPSKPDLEVTETICKAGKMMQIELLDHVIIGRDNYDFYSFQQYWMIKN